MYMKAGDLNQITFQGLFHFYIYLSLVHQQVYGESTFRFIL